MKLVVGLGNPGRRYAHTRHNVGFRVVEHFAAQCDIALSQRRFGGLFGVRVRYGSGTLPSFEPRSGTLPSYQPGGGAPPSREPGGETPLRAGEAEEIRVGVLEPLTFMNRSGNALSAALTELPVGAPAESLLVCFDDVDLPFGRLRLRPRGGAGGHRGVAHLIERLGHGDFARLRFGVGRPPPGLDTVEHVLEPFSDEEEASLGKRLDRAADAVRAVLREGVAAAMNRFNAPEAAPSEPPPRG